MKRRDTVMQNFLHSQPPPPILLIVDTIFAQCSSPPYSTSSNFWQPLDALFLVQSSTTEKQKCESVRVELGAAGHICAAARCDAVLEAARQGGMLKKLKGNCRDRTNLHRHYYIPLQRKHVQSLFLS